MEGLNIENASLTTIRVNTKRKRNLSFCVCVCVWMYEEEERIPIHRNLDKKENRRWVFAQTASVASRLQN